MEKCSTASFAKIATFAGGDFLRLRWVLWIIDRGEVNYGRAAAEAETGFQRMAHTAAPRCLLSIFVLMEFYSVISTQLVHAVAKSQYFQGISQL